ncbi:MAG: nicotinate (nicotinamide) nucleotide adenylyltransferase [Clostridia bacterium]|nr:nicotinate (nicotinamide) nucleotide adenylyltransferase [Clostridia bacterium]
MRIGIFGGTFNPVHKGHKKLALEIKEKAELDKVIIMPACTPPHKQGKELASGEHRLSMCRMMFSEECFTVSDLEIRREGKSYTVDTMTQLKELYPDDELFLIVGSDMLLSFHRWYRYEDILSMATLCVATREDSVSFTQLKAYAEETLSLKSDKNEIIIADIEPYECSSTQIRELINVGADASEYIGDEVNGYIRTNLLYESPYMDYKRILREKLDDYRFIHSLNVADSAKTLASMYGENEERAYFAGLLHDIMKNENDADMLKIIEKGDIILSRIEKSNPKLWHAIAGEAYLRTELGIDDEEILSAVRYHTTGKAGMSRFEKIIYVADYISAERNYPDVGVMRRLSCETGLDEACLYSLQYTLKALSAKETVIHPDSLDFYNELIINKGESYDRT